jgi:hypothetical protein
MSAELPGSDEALAARYPSTARIWNYQLGGTDNFDVDRQASEAANAMVRGLGVPAGAETAAESRHLLQRMVDYMLGQGGTRPPHCAGRKAADILRGRYEPRQRSPGRGRGRRLSHFPGKLNRSATTPSGPAWPGPSP